MSNQLILHKLKVTCYIARSHAVWQYSGRKNVTNLAEMWAKPSQNISVK